MSALIQPQQILDHLQDCKKENQQKLKNVRNLEDLVKFKLTTVVDKLKENSEGQEMKGIEIFQKLCDPLLVNKHYPSLTKKAYYMKPLDKSQQLYTEKNESETQLPRITKFNDFRLE